MLPREELHRSLQVIILNFDILLIELPFHPIARTPLELSDVIVPLWRARELEPRAG